MRLGLSLALTQPRNVSGGVVATPSTNDVLSVEVLGGNYLNDTGVYSTANWVDPNGWVAAVKLKGMAAGGVTDGTKLSITVSSPGFDTAGNATTISRTIPGVAALRKPYPNLADEYQTTSGSDTIVHVVLDSRIYASDTITDVTVSAGLYTVSATPSNASGTFTTETNNSGFAYEVPMAWPVTPPREVAAGTITAEVAVTHPWFAGGKTAAAVRFQFKDGTNTVTAWASTMSASGERLSGQGNPLPVFKVSGVDISSLADGVCWWEFKVFPIRGDVTFDSPTDGVGFTGAEYKADLTRGIPYDCPKAVPFVKNASATFTTYYASVDPVSGVNSDSASHVSTTLATAEANPCLSINYAAWQLQKYGTGSNVIYVIRLKEGTYVGFGANGTVAPLTLTRTASWLTVEPATGAAKANIIIGGTGTTSSTRNFPRRTKIKGVTIAGDNGVSSGRVLEGAFAAAGTWAGGFDHELMVDDCALSMSANNATANIFAQCGIILRNTNTTGANYIGQIGGRPGVSDKDGLISAFFNELLGTFSTMVTPRLFGNLTECPPSIVALTQNSSGVAFLGGRAADCLCIANSTYKMNNTKWVIASKFTRGVGFFQNLIEPYTGGAAKGIELYGDSTGTDAANVQVAFNSIPGEAFNFMYNDTGFKTTFNGSPLPTPLATTSGSATVTVTLTGHALNTGDTVNIAATAAVGGISTANLNGNKTITVVDANTFTYTAGAAATSTASGGSTSHSSPCVITVNFAKNGRYRKTGSWQYNFVADHNMKSDEYNGTPQSTSDGARVGNWELRYWVDCPGNAIFAGEETDGGSGSLLGELLKTSAGWASKNACYTGQPGYTNYQGLANAMWSLAAGSGYGDYRPTSSSCAINRADRQAFPFDLDGTTRRTDGTGAAGALERAS